MFVGNFQRSSFGIPLSAIRYDKRCSWSNVSAYFHNPQCNGKYNGAYSHIWLLHIKTLIDIFANMVKVIWFILYIITIISRKTGSQCACYIVICSQSVYLLWTNIFMGSTYIRETSLISSFI